MADLVTMELEGFIGRNLLAIQNLNNLLKFE
jgi:hypothetical protein